MPPINVRFDISWNKTFTVLLFILFYSLQQTCQTLTVNDTSKSSEDLVSELIGNSCISRSNINISSSQSVAYFNNNGGSFPISEGVIIRNGIAKHTSGAYTNQNLSSNVNSSSDADLQAISNDNGQVSTITDVAFLEFDFVPMANEINFNFLFASNEYGQYQCSFSDVFAIILTNIATGESVNLAVLPNSDTNISVKNIRNNVYNNSCTSINEEYFSTYNVDNAANSSLNMRGFTKVMNAYAEVIANNSYNIKFVIGDYSDSSFDSAVFIESGSFETTFNLGEDQELCEGNEITLDSQYTNTTDFSFQWYKDDAVLQGATTPALTISQTGTYKLVVEDLRNHCKFTDQVLISSLQIEEPKDIVECYTGEAIAFDLTLVNQSTLGIDPEKYDVLYYNSMENVQNNISISSDTLENYTSYGDEKIFIKLINTIDDAACDKILSFNLVAFKIDAVTPNDIELCESEKIVNLPLEVEAQILTRLDSLRHNVSYFTTLEDATNDTNQIEEPAEYLLPESNNELKIWTRVTSTLGQICTTILDFKIIINALPEVDNLPNVYECSEYILPVLNKGKYYTKQRGEGTQLFAGDKITRQMRVYIYDTNEKGCENESNFVVYLAGSYSIPVNHCGRFVVPYYRNAVFYSEAKGSNKPGSILPTGTVITESQKIYFYAKNNDGDACAEKVFPIVINEIPLVDTLEDVVTCDSYVLPSLTNGNYYTAPNGGGSRIPSGTAIKESKALYIFNMSDKGCTNQSTFKVTILDTTVLTDVTICERYTIPNTPIGNYYTEIGGAGEVIPSGTELRSSQTIYFYASEITTTPNCTEEISMYIKINPLPLVDTKEDTYNCIDDLPTLPSLTNGKYFTMPNGEGTQLYPGDVISTTTRVYVYNTNEYCDAQTSFDVTITPFPLVDNFTDVFSCGSYILPTLANGNYYTAPNGGGVQLQAGDEITENQTIYIYNTDSRVATCVNENVFEVNILQIEADSPEDVFSCETYELPALQVGDYFTQPNGMGRQIYPGTIISETQTLYIYATNGGRFMCTDESEFTITIFKKPNLSELQNIISCGSVTLPNLGLENTVVEYYRMPNRVGYIDPSEYTITQSGSQNIYVYAYPEGSPSCYEEGQFIITVQPMLEMDIEGGVICVNYDTGIASSSLELKSGVSETKFDINWYLNGELVGKGANYTATQAGTYRVETVKLTPSSGLSCNYNPAEVVVEASSPKFEVEFMSEDFSDTYTVEVKTIHEGYGEYVYSLDNRPFQKSNRFYDVKPGEYTVVVKDISNYCGDFNLKFTALAHPDFFTPNDDGNNDTWNIADLRNDKTATVKIFTRFGKLVAIIKPSGTGWNGFNQAGTKVASNDYWFEVDYDKDGERASYRNHVSLLRK